MELAYQVPIPHLDKSWGDFDFALAHLMLNDPTYARYYIGQRKLGRKVLLDNSLHELGEPLNIPMLLQAFDLLDPTYIIPPDWHGNRAATIEATQQLAEQVPLDRIAPVVQGKHLEELTLCYSYYLQAGYGLVCIPYRLGPLRTALIAYLNTSMQHHFLGLNTPKELALIATAPHASLDTGKPFRYAQNNRYLYDGASAYDRDPSPPPKLQMDKTCSLTHLYANFQTLLSSLPG